MSFQNTDSQLKDYVNEFNRNESSFILKPKLFRMDNPEIETVIDLGPSSKQTSQMETTIDLMQSIGAS